MFNDHLILHVVKQSVSAEDDDVAFLDSKRRCLGRIWAATPITYITHTHTNTLTHTLSLLQTVQAYFSATSLTTFFSILHSTGLQF